MKKLGLIALAVSAALVPAAASAQVVVRSPGSTVITGGGFHHPRFDRHHFFNGGGFFVGGFFFQPQFHVQNWQLYGFAHPGQHRWIRHYDDALLIDRRGRVHDFRENVAWDRYGERWHQDESGIPYYVGRGDFHPDERDYGYAARERYDYRDDRRAGYREEYRGGGWDYSDYGRSYGHGGGYASPAPCGGSPCGYPAAPAYNYGSGSAYGSTGYSYGSGYFMAPVVITETTVTPATTVITEEVVEEVVYEQRAARRARPHRPRAVRPCNCPPPRRSVHRSAPRHPPGERG